MTTSATVERAPITEDWLRSVHFKWQQLERQPERHWLLWIGDAAGTTYEDLGIEVTSRVPGEPESWFCWIRADYAGRYSRFVHVRHLRYQDELIALFEGLTGQRWDPANNVGGSASTPAQAERRRRDDERLDRVWQRSHPWRDDEKDQTRAGPTVQETSELRARVDRKPEGSHG